MTDYADYLDALCEVQSALKDLQMVYDAFHKNDFYTTSDNYLDIEEALRTVEDEIKDVETFHPEVFADYGDDDWRED